MDDLIILAPIGGGLFILSIVFTSKTKKVLIISAPLLDHFILSLCLIRFLIVNEDTNIHIKMIFFLNLYYYLVVVWVLSLVKLYYLTWFLLFATFSEGLNEEESSLVYKRLE